MKKIIKQYIKVVSMSLIGLAFGFSSFYLFINLYHYSEIRRSVVINSESDPSIIELENSLSNIRKNISTFKSTNYNGKLNYSNAYDINRRFNKCLDSFNNEDYLKLIEGGNLNIKDVYNLLNSLNNDVLNDCIVNQMYYLVTNKDIINSNTYLKNNNKLLKSYMDNLLRETSYLEKDILNNSSYYFNTDIISLTVKNNTRDGLNEVISSYSNVAKFLEILSEWYASDVSNMAISSESRGM